jgi:hypothetical protein
MRLRDFLLYIILIAAVVIFVTSLVTHEVANFLIGGMK